MRFRSSLVIASAVAIAFAGAARADDASDLKAKFEALQKEMEAVKAQMERVTEQLKKQKEEQEKAAAAPPAAKPEKAAAKSPMETLFDKLTKGFYGTIDVSGDYVTKGMGDKVAGSGFGWTQTGPNTPAGVGQGFFTPHTGVKSTVINPATGETTTHPVGNVGWLPGLSTNKSGIGYRGSHSMPWDLTFLYQIEGNFSLTSSPGLSTSYTAQSNVTKAALGFGNTWIGVSTKGWGTFKAGTAFAPYKTSTDRMNPFSGMLGDYAVVMGNSGGDNRVEFGTRLEHAFWYESPKMFGGFSFDFLVSPGQNRTYDAVVQSSGSPDCNGSNSPGSGNLPLNCDDGGFTSAYSLDVKYETKNLYLTAAYERHNDVNRNSDGIGSNNPIYGYFFGLATSGGPNVLLLDLTPVTNVAANGGAVVGCGPGGTSVCPTTIPLGAYTTDVGPETAAKFGAQYNFDFGLSVAGVYEILHRDLPSYLEFQNERSRIGYWLTGTQQIGESMEVSFGYAHAGQTPGDPGGQHNFDPFAPTDSAEMYTIAFKQKIDKQMYWYVNAAETFNHGNVHYDLGAGGRGYPTDCHDGNHATQVDYTGFGPTTWGGCKIKGLSVGIDYKF